MATAKDVIAMAKEQGAQIVDFRFCDLPGLMQHFSVPVAELTESVFEDGIGFDGSSIRGFQQIFESDMLLDPDPDTAFMDPFTDHVTLNINCFVKDPVTGEMYSRDPRFIARKAELYLKQTGIADVSYWGPEAEFYIFDSIRFDQNQFEGYYHIDAEEGVWNSGTAGPDEIDMRFDSLLKTADNVLKYKYVVKNTAWKAGKTVTFMPKPIFQDNGSGMHTHQSLWKNDENLFWDEVGYAGISDMARWYIGGLLVHAPSLLAFTNPTTNSYRRLVPGYEAPVKLVYSQRNRSACVRIPMISRNPVAKRLEFRTPDPSCNPYLAFPAMLMAGLDGIKNKIEPPEPMDKDLYDLPPAEQAMVKEVPGSLDEVLDNLEADHQWLLEGGVFTQDVIDTWLEYKRTRELDQVRLRPHPWEFMLYYDI